MSPTAILLWFIPGSILIFSSRRPAQSLTLHAGIPASMHGSAFQRFPHFYVALGSPDPRVVVPCGFVIGPGNVERHAVVEDDPVRIAGLHEIVSFTVDGLEILAGCHAIVHAVVQVGKEAACARQGLANFCGAFEGGAAARDHFLGVEAGQTVKSLWPVAEIGVAGVGSGLVL